MPEYPKPSLLSLSPVLGNGTTIYIGVRVVNPRMILDSSAFLPSLSRPIIKSGLGGGVRVEGSHF